MIVLALKIFFSVLFASFILLLIVYVIAKKYMNGDFVRVSAEEEKQDDIVSYDSDTEDVVSVAKYSYYSDANTEEEYVIVPEKPDYLKKVPGNSRAGMAGKLATAASLFHQYTEEETQLFLLDNKERLIADAKLIITLEFLKDKNCLLGIINSLDNVDFNVADAPQLIRFRIRVLPKKLPEVKTRWRPVNTSQTDMMLSVSFTISAMRPEDMLENSLCIRLYGKRTTILSKQKCCGECFLSLKSLHYSNTKQSFTKQLYPKADGQLEKKLQWLTSDSEQDVS